MEENVKEYVVELRDDRLGFAEQVSILGTVYRIEMKKRSEDPGFYGHPCANGFADYLNKRIVLADMTDNEQFEGDRKGDLVLIMRKTLRHEIVHAFLYESGLAGETRSPSPWAKNEEVVDWIAIQGPKLMRAWRDSGAM